MLERRHHPVASQEVFIGRCAKWLLATAFLLGVSLFAGMAGYHYLEQMSWLSAFVNAAMILGGMGPVDVLKTTGGQLFAGIYAIYCGVLLVLCGGLLLVPVFHRVLHRFHAEN